MPTITKYINKFIRVGSKSLLDDRIHMTSELITLKHVIGMVPVTEGGLHKIVVRSLDSLENRCCVTTHIVCNSKSEMQEIYRELRDCATEIMYVRIPICRDDEKCPL